MKLVVFLFVLIVTILCANSQKPPKCARCPLCTPSTTCGAVCTFRLCSPEPELLPKARRIIIRPPFFSSLNPTICRNKEERVGFIVKTGEALVEMSPTSVIPISQYRRDVLTKGFNKRFFLTKKIPAVGRSVIIRKKSKGNQESFLDDLCIRLPVLKYERVSGKRVKLVKTKKRESDCIAFSTRTLQLFIQLIWTSKDDLDLAVVQPDGQLLSRFNPRTKNCGRFAKDSNSESCSQDKIFGAENVKYFSDATKVAGTYTLQVRHFKNCGFGPTDWTIRASVNGKLILQESGKSNKNDDTLIFEKNLQVAP